MIASSGMLRGFLVLVPLLSGTIAAKVSSATETREVEEVAAKLLRREERSNTAPGESISQAAAINSSDSESAAVVPGCHGCVIDPKLPGDDPVLALAANTKKVFSRNYKLSKTAADAEFVGGDSLANVFSQTREQNAKSEHTFKTEMDGRDKQVKNAKLRADAEIREKGVKGDNLIAIKAQKEKVSKAVPAEQEKVDKKKLSARVQDLNARNQKEKAAKGESVLIVREKTDKEFAESRGKTKQEQVSKYHWSADERVKKGEIVTKSNEVWKASLSEQKGKGKQENAVKKKMSQTKAEIWDKRKGELDVKAQTKAQEKAMKKSVYATRLEDVNKANEAKFKSEDVAKKEKEAKCEDRRKKSADLSDKKAAEKEGEAKAKLEVSNKGNSIKAKAAKARGSLNGGLEKMYKKEKSDKAERAANFAQASTTEVKEKVSEKNTKQGRIKKMSQ